MRDAPLPVTLLTGFLGAGKTTLLRRLLQAPTGLRIGVVLNEFGEAGIDDVRAADQAFVEISQGCACCLRNPELLSAMQELGGRRDLDRVIVETSGLADPLPIAWGIEKPELQGIVRLDAVVTVVDAANFAKAGAEEWGSQVRNADVVLVTKADLAPAGAVEAAKGAVRQVNPRVRFLDPADPAFAPLLLDAKGDARGDRPTEMPEAAHSEFDGFEISGGTYRLNDLEDVIDTLPAEVFRAKGIVETEGARWMRFHAVGGRLVTELDVAAPEHGMTRMLLFGRGFDEPALRAAIDACRS